jgi:hypothetical protein
MRINACDMMLESRKNSDKFRSKKYKVVSGAVITFTNKSVKTVKVANGELFSDEAKSLILYISNNTELEEVETAVPFLEAVKAYSKGKTIRCEIGEEARVYDYKVGYGMTNIDHYAITVGEILNGKWYVEESNE